MAFLCSYCRAQVFKSRARLDRHLLACHREDAVCPHCHKTFTKKRNRDAHAELFHDSHAKYQCRFCPKRYRWPNGRRKHEANVHNMKKEDMARKKKEDQRCLGLPFPLPEGPVPAVLPMPVILFQDVHPCYFGDESLVSVEEPKHCGMLSTLVD